MNGMPKLEKIPPLGLPPMELAEPTTNDRTAKKCTNPFIQRVLGGVILFLIVAGSYILLLTLLQYFENSRTEIIIVTSPQTNANLTLERSNIEINVQFKNKTTLPPKRVKRDLSAPKENSNGIKYKNILDEKAMKKARSMLMKHNVACSEENTIEICKDLVTALKSIDKNMNVEIIDNEYTISKSKTVGTDLNRDVEELTSTEKSIKQMLPLENIEMIRAPNMPFQGKESYAYENHASVHSYPQHLHDSPLDNTCILARILNKNLSNAHSIYDSPPTDYLPTHYDKPPAYSKFAPATIPSSYFHNRDTESSKRKIHPQDYDILQTIIGKIRHTDEHVARTREAECTEGSLPCDNGDSCVEPHQWCDGNVDCSDASDESRCSCKSRVDKSRLCDGYFDCPSGEDEMGCNGCSKSMFSCENFEVNSQSTCFTKEQRCNNVADCTNHRDEIDCTMLAPTLHKKPMFAISNTEGFLHRNFKGDWYAICKNPYMWAHDACRRETGLIIRPPIIELLPIDPFLKVDYLSAVPGGVVETGDTCFSSSAIYVTCPDLLCGTRMVTTSQLLREDTIAENQLFGRNKRQDQLHPFSMFRNLAKRNAPDPLFSDIKSNKNNDRNKRTESRVVGGKASKPAAWPWMVAVYRDGTFHCGGVVLTQSWVMSAAHCVHKFWAHYYEIQVGMLRRFSFSPQDQNRLVTHVIVNHKYNQMNMKNDVSLLKVKPSIQFSRWVRPICLPGPETAGPNWLWGPAPGTMCTAVGWGATVEHGPDPDHMREVEIPVWSKCKHREDEEGKEICAGLIEGGKDACQGDSGGPLLCKNPLNSQQWYMAGIVSHGDGCGRKDEPGVYTRVSLFVKWIRYHIFSKSLPSIQPKQECPGFKCISGISKCLPLKRMCDKIVDCLDGEDEINCSSMRTSSSLGDLFLSTSEENNPERKRNLETKEAENSSSEETSSHEESHKTDVEIIHDAQSSDSKKIFEKESIITNVSHGNAAETLSIQSLSDENLKPTTESIINHINQQQITEMDISSISETTEFMKGTTVIEEAINSNENPFEFNSNSSENIESITVDPERPATNGEAQSSFRGDLQSITTSLSKESLESRSSVLENKDSDIHEDFSDTLSMDPTTSPSTMTTETPIEHHENALNENKSNQNTDDSNDKTDNSSSKQNKTEIISNKDNSTHLSALLEKENTLLESKNILIDLPDHSTISRNKEHTHKFINNDNTTESEAKHKIFGDNEGVLDKIEDIIASQLQPPKHKKKHLIPNVFNCQRILQTVPYAEKCDRKADCEDGTDELGCTCLDYLSRFENQLICDGIMDCADGQDELDCYSCAEDQFLCKRSQLCLPNKYVCDDKPQCPQGEDELDCFALTNGQSILYDFDARPKVNLEGFLTKKHHNDWHVVCDYNLSIKQQEQSANYICRYLGFSSANRYLVKHINIKEDDTLKTRSSTDKRSRRRADEMPIHFAYESLEEGAARHIVIKEPQLLKEHCVPNVTKTCQSLYVFCDHSLYNNFEISNDIIYRSADTVTHMWPWVAKIFTDGEYKCTGILVDLSWVLVSHLCLWDTLLSHQRVTAVLGSHRTLSATKGMYEQTYQVDSIKDLYHNRVALLHLNEPAIYSNMVKPMVISSSTMQNEKPSMCVAVGQDGNNNTVGLFLKETNENCYLHSRCFVRSQNMWEKDCPSNMVTNRQWAGIISCLTEQGWYPVATFVDSRGECGVGDKIIGTEIGGLRNEMKIFMERARSVPDSDKYDEVDECNGQRCGRGKCIKMQQVCDGVSQCEDGKDEDVQACEKKNRLCTKDPFNGGCECSSGQIKCINGKCIAKELYRDGNDDCGDNSDEPPQMTCAHYLSRVEPGRVCDGILHCKDRSDEDPMYCKCFAKKSFYCNKGYKNVDHCIAQDMVCDGIKDCSNGEDEQACMGLGAPEGYKHGMGQVIIRSHGVWYSKCYHTQNHTKSQLEDICRQLGFISGHAKKIELPPNAIMKNNNFLLDPFSDIVLNNNTMISIRNSNDPIATPILDENLKDCYPVFVECV